MEEPASTPESAISESLSAYELLILHTAEAREWASYLQEILKCSRKFGERPTLLYALGPADRLHGYNFECFRRCRCVVLLLTGGLLDMLCELELQAALQRLLRPPHRVVALLCGMAEEHVPPELFTDWPRWRKLSAEDEPAVYVSAILESIDDSIRVEAEHECEAVAAVEFHTTAAPPSEEPSPALTQEGMSDRQTESVPRGEPSGAGGSSTSQDTSTPPQLTCLTVQPDRVLCGDLKKLFIIFTHKVDDRAVLGVDFSSENIAAKRVPITLENEYTISVTAPDMPAGVASLTLCTDQSCVSLPPVTYYTCMGEVSRLLDGANDPIGFICQAFDLTSNTTEALDNMLTDSLKSRLPLTSFHLFGIRQIEEDNMAAYQRDEQLPTLLHFAARYGLKKLTSTLLQCPGALQAYSVMNRDGDYPNTLAQRSGFSDLRQFIDEFVETAVMLKCHMEQSVHTEESAEVYEMMSASSQDILLKYSGCSEDIYESMLGIDPDCAEDLYEEMDAVNLNPEDAMLRKFFQAKPRVSVKEETQEEDARQEEKDEHDDLDQIEEEEDPYNLFPEDIYDTVDAKGLFNSEVLNRPPAPVPRPEAETEKSVTYISRVFSDKNLYECGSMETEKPAAGPVEEPPSPPYDPYAGMKTPGQRQLISLQERVKVGEITVEEAVQEFKCWQAAHERRAHSIRYQQENLKRLRDSITRRHKEREKTGKELDLEISAPMQRNLYWGASTLVECSVYEPAPRQVTPLPPPPPANHNIQRGGWKTGSTSSVSSTESNRLSTHSTVSYSSGTEPDFEDALENVPPPPRPPRSSDVAAHIPPPRIPPRLPERVPEKNLHERYISCPTRPLPHRPANSNTEPPPPLPRRTR